MNSSSIVEIADLQDFLKEKMQQLYPESITIKQGKHINIEAIEPENCILSYKDRGKSQKLKFSHLVAADGARHQTANLAKKSGATQTRSSWNCQRRVKERSEDY